MSNMVTIIFAKKTLACHIDQFSSTRILIIHSILSNTLHLLLNKPINIHSGLTIRLFSYYQKFKPLLNGSLRNFFLKDTIVVVEIDILLTWGLPSK